MMMNEIVDRLQRCTRISNRFGYHCPRPSSVSRKTLNPNFRQNVAPLISENNRSSSPDSSSGSSESYPLQEKSIISTSRSGSFSISCFGLYSCRKMQSLSCSLSGSVSNCYSDPYLPNGWLSTSCNFSSGRPKIHSLMDSFSHPLSSSSLRKVNSNYIIRSFTVSSSKGTNISGSVVDSEVHNAAGTCSDEQKLENTNTYPPDFVSEVIEILRNCEEDLEARLNMLSSRLLSVCSITNTFEVLNTRRISGWRFFEWVRSNNPRLRRNANICSLIVDNFGRLDDYESLFVLFKMFTSEKICLTYEAFRFLHIMAPTNSLLNEATQRVVDLLNKVGGSCRNSGVHALVEMFCKSNSFEMARYVIKITESRKSYYCILIREKCKNGLIEDAHSIIFEMQENHCVPNTAVYNYLLGSLWRNGKFDEAFALIVEMREFGIPPDEITFEILINVVCSLGKMDDAHKLLDQMASQGLEPRPTTHARVVKALFAAEKYEMAHEFVVGSSCKTSGNMMYSLMANLYREKGDILSAREVLVEMMEKCLKPNFSVYVKIVNGLGRSGKGYLVKDLESRHRKFMVKSRA